MSKPRYISVTRPRCPSCGSTKIKAYRTTQLGGDALLRYAKCGKCAYKFVVIAR